MPSSLHKKSFLETIKLQIKLGMKVLFNSNPILPFTVILLVIGVSAGLVLTENSTELRQQAAYFNCIAPSTEILTGADFGMCRCPSGAVINPSEICASPTSIVSNPTGIATVTQTLDNGCSASGGTCKMSCLSGVETTGSYCSGSSSGPVCCYHSTTPTPTQSAGGIGGVTRYSCVNSACITSTTGEFLSVGECGAACRLSPTPTPVKAALGQKCSADLDCATTYCDLISQTCRQNPSCPYECAGGCFTTDNNGDHKLDCRPFCRSSCQYGCKYETTTGGGECKGECTPGPCDATGRWCGVDEKYTSIKCTPGQKSCDHFNTGMCIDNSPTPTPMCKQGTYRCVNGNQYRCFGNGEESTSCGIVGCDSQTNRCRDNSCNTLNGTVIDRNLNTYCCDGKISVGACSAISLGAIGESCNTINNCIKGLICDKGTCAQCHGDSCSGGKWCGHDGRFTSPIITCTSDQKTCDNYSTGVCIDNTPYPTLTPVLGAICRRNIDCGWGYECVRDSGDNSFSCKALPTLTPIPTATITPKLDRPCRQNSDCSLGYMCLKDSLDNTFSCQPEQKTKDCWTYNLSTKQCEKFKSYSGVSCPTGSSPNYDICVHPTPSPATQQIACFNREQGYQQMMCVGNNVIDCNVNTGETEVVACPGGCAPLWGCFPPRPRGSACTVGTQWCDGNTLATCSYSNARSDAAMAPEISTQMCAYGCDSAINKCANPSSATYLETLEQDIEKRHGIAIAVLSNDQKEVGYTLEAFDNAYKNLPKTLTNEVRSIVILPGTNGAGGETLMDGRVEFYQCSESEFQSRLCEKVATHEIAHNTEQVQVTSPLCFDGNSCQVLEGFINAAAKDPHPIVFDTHGDLVVADSDLQGMNSNSNQNQREYLAEYTADYFLYPEKLKNSHPLIYSFYQDVYHEY